MLKKKQTKDEWNQTNGKAFLPHLLSTGALLRCNFLIYRLNRSAIVVPTESQRHPSLFICHLFFHLLNGSLCCGRIISNAVSSDAALKNMSKHSPIILQDCCLCTSMHASVLDITGWGECWCFPGNLGGTMLNIYQKLTCCIWCVECISVLWIFCPQLFSLLPQFACLWFSAVMKRWPYWKDRKKWLLSRKDEVHGNDCGVKPCKGKSKASIRRIGDTLVLNLSKIECHQ